MTKQTDKKSKELGKGREEKPQEEEEEEEEEQSSDGDEDEEEQGEGDESDQDEADESEEEEDDKVASAKPSVKKSRSSASEEDDEAEEEEEEETEEEETEEEEEEDEAEAPAEAEDPYWWTPHAVLGALVFIGVLGFFGVFNKAFGFLASKRAPAPETPAAAAAPPAKPSARPFQPPSQQQPQAPAQMFGAKHLLVMYKGGRRAPPNVSRTKEEAKARAEEALKKIKSGKVKFEEAVAEYSDEPGAAQRGGDLKEFPKGSMVPEFQAGLEKIKVGEVSDLVETPFGYHVILRTK